MDPTPHEQIGFHMIADVADWAALDGAANDTETARGSLFRALGVTGSEHPRILAAIPDVNYDAIVSAWRIAESLPTAAQIGQARLVAHGCKVTCRPGQVVEEGDPACWSEGFNWATCCSDEHGPRGNIACWDPQFTFERCCRAQSSPRLEASPPPLGPSKPPGLMEGIMAANAQGPNGEVIQLVPTYYVFVFVGTLICLWAVSYLLSCILRCCSRSDVARDLSPAEVEAQRQKRMEKFHDTVEVEQSGNSARRRVGIH